MEKASILLLLLHFLIINGHPTKTKEIYPEEHGEYFEGDMIFEGGQMGRAGLTSNFYRWPRNENGTVIIHYEIREGSPYSTSDLQRIQAAMNEIQNNTCIRFERRKNETDYFEIFSGNGCFSTVGRARGRQNLSLMRFGCLLQGIIVHEMMHTLGFFHMHSNYDRDEYIRINYENIEPGREHNFNKFSKSVVSLFETTYDFDSLMHYRANAFSKNGRNTIETLNPNNMNRIGQRDRMSPGDVKRVNKMYC